MNATPKNAMMASSSANPSRINPFCDISPFNVPLKAETCQQMHANALRRVARNPQAYTAPPEVSITGLRAQALRYGPQVYLAHPAEIERLFSGVTLSVYREIEVLYCSRLGRSYATVNRILRAMALDAGVAPVEAEAVWAICMHLEELRAERAAVTLERSSSNWRLVSVAFTDTSERTSIDASGRTRLLATLVIDVDATRVLAFRADERGNEAELYSFALYDAIVSERRPHPEGAGGLLWRIPTRLVVEGALPENCQLGCKILGIVTERAREELERAFSHLVGYSQDPAQFFPALRAFLPTYPAIIDREGTVAFDGLHYANDLLSHWPDSCVTVRRSEYTEAVLWVYLEREILCQAMARELARRDGSYRAARARR